MNVTRRRLLACVLAVMLCMAAFPISASADGGDYYDYELPPNYYDYSQEYYPQEYYPDYSQVYTPTPLYPDGNMSIVSDITGAAASDKEFITVVSKSGNYFFIIIDRSGSGENQVYFLNKVDEADLLSLLSEKEREQYLQTQQPTPTIAPTPVPTSAPAPIPTQQPGTDSRPAIDNITRATVILGLIAVSAVAAILYLHAKKNAKPNTKGSTNLDDYDFGTDDDGEEEENFIDLDAYDAAAEGDAR